MLCSGSEAWKGKLLKAIKERGYGCPRLRVQRFVPGQDSNVREKMWIRWQDELMEVLSDWLVWKESRMSS